MVPGRKSGQSPEVEVESQEGYCFKMIIFKHISKGREDFLKSILYSAPWFHYLNNGEIFEDTSQSCSEN